LSAGLKERKERKIEKKQPKKNLVEIEQAREEALPGGRRHLLAALHGNDLARDGFGPEALGSRRLARAGIRGRGLVLLALGLEFLGHEFVNKLFAGLGLQRRRMLMDLWVKVG
jgi:hypothetical protein